MERTADCCSPGKRPDCCSPWGEDPIDTLLEEDPIVLLYGERRIVLLRGERSQLMLFLERRRLSFYVGRTTDRPSPSRGEEPINALLVCSLLYTVDLLHVGAWFHGHIDQPRTISI